MLESIDIIVPIYNMEDRLERCIKSLIRQVSDNYFNYKILLINDGSTDKTQDICNLYSAKYPSKIETFTKKNGGVSSARNFGLTKATSDYISFVDPDDYVLPMYLLNLYKALKETGADISSSWFQEVWNEDSVESTTGSLEGLQEFSSIEALRKLFYQDGLEFAVWGKLIKRKLFSNILFPNGKRYEDISVTYKLISKCDKVAVIKNKDYIYYQREDGMLNSKFNVTKLDIISEMNSLYDSVISTYPELKSAVSCRYFAGLSNVYFQIPDRFSQKEDIWKYMKAKRNIAILDKNASKKVRFGALSMYFGKKTMNYLYKRTQKRGKLIQ